ncbi:MAG TPA: hypothetical protein VGM93_04075, partial [Acidimicrobiales bacterium]
MGVSSRFGRRSGVVALLALVAAVLPVLGSAPAGTAASVRSLAGAARGATSAVRDAPAPALTVTPTTGLTDDQSVSFYATNTVPNSTFVFAECGPTALAIFSGSLPPEDNPNDGCEQQRDAIVFSDGAGVVAGKLRLATVLTTAVGTDDCRHKSCFVALFSLSGTEGPLLSNITFASNACAATGSCTVTRSLGQRAGSAVAAASVAGSTTVVHPRVGSPIGTATVGTPVSFSVSAGPAGDLSIGDEITGPADGALGGNAAPGVPVSGEGLVRLTLDGPGTSWDSTSAPSVVVDVAVDGGTAQQMVLFRGATPFTYA